MDISKNHKPKRKFSSRLRIKHSLQITAIIAIVICWWWFVRPAGLPQQLRAVCRIEARTWYVVRDGGNDSLLISAGCRQTTDHEGNPQYADSVSISGFFVSASGMAVTTDSALLRAPERLTADTLRSILRHEQARLKTLRQHKAEALKELAYYARTHTVIDDGYNEVMAYKEKAESQAAAVDSALKTVSRLLSQRSITGTLRANITLSVGHTEKQADAKTPCRIIDRKNGLLLLQTYGLRTPIDATATSLYNGTPGGKETLILGHFSPNGDAIVMPLEVLTNANGGEAEGSIVTDGYGRTLGVLSRGRVVGLKEIRALCFANNQRIKWWKDNLVAACRHALLPPNAEHRAADTGTVVHAEWLRHNIACRHKQAGHFKQLTLDSGLYIGMTNELKPNGFGCLYERNGNLHKGYWKNGRVDGAGVTFYTDGHTLRGTWHSGNQQPLTSGEWISGDTCYLGGLDSLMRPEGTGILKAGGTYYSGEWVGGKRHGFGFSVGEKHMVRAGIWKNGIFRGERMTYTPDRVYGIDISRYQHEIGKKRHAIDWNKVRVTKLGIQNTKHVAGRQNYPVRFVYIKASEGTKIRNRYYAADAAACRRRGIRVGAYHFFSTQTGGAAQARHFLKTARPQRGDLPPVLDVEPYDRQIAAMGGSAAMFREMTAWVNTVHRYCDVMPVLYISQTFVNKYMRYAPPRLAQCQVWIARYSEYRPYVHLLYWQLSPRGRVSGIKGDVDINVFNGTLAQFEQYASRACIK